MRAGQSPGSTSAARRSIDAANRRTSSPGRAGITNTSSGVIAPIPGLGISNTLRAALVGWSKTLSSEVAADGVTCNIVVPGRIATDRLEQLDAARAQRAGSTVEQARAASIAQIPVGRYGDPGEYADLVAFLASPRAAYVTGSVLRIDGGLIAAV